MPAPEDEAGTWSGLITVCRHRDGTRVPVEVAGRPRQDKAGMPAAYEGITRPLGPRRATADSAKSVRARIDRVLTRKTLQIWFQPIRCLNTGAVVGAEALSRFPEAAIRPPESWFTDAESVGLGRDLELLALETALKVATKLPGHLYVSVNLSPQSCLDPRLHDIVLFCSVPAGRLVLEVTERAPVNDYEPLAAALVSLRCSGVRVAVDDAGAGFASMRHILQLQPDQIKLDHGIVAGMDTNLGQRALGAAMVSFARDVGAVLIAEGIETDAELAAVAGLGIQAGQGYLLGKPSDNPEVWLKWHTAQAKRLC